MHFFISAGEAKTAAAVPAHCMARELFELRVKLGAIHMDLGHIERRVEMRALACCVPGGARGQLALLDEDNIAPALKREMIEKTDPHHAATDNHYPCMRFHQPSPHQPVSLI